MEKNNAKLDKKQGAVSENGKELKAQETEEEKERRMNEQFSVAVKKWQENTLNAIKQARDVEYLAQTPIVMPQLNESAFLNMVIADSGAGKSLLARGLAQFILDNYDDIVVLWFDLEFQEAVSKQRRVDVLMERYQDRFFLINQHNIVQVKEQLKLETTFAVVNRLIDRFQKLYKEKKFFVVVDSFEDLVDDSSNDTELKRHFSNMLSKKSISFLVNHHVNKDNTKSVNMRFRGSMVVKAKLTTLLYLQKNIKEDDFTRALELVALKIRAAFPPTDKLVVKIDTNEWVVKDIAIATDTEEMRILRSLFFTLKKQNKLNKTALINEVSNEVKKRKEKVRSVVDKYIRFFVIEKGAKREEIVSLTNDIDLLDELCALIGVQNTASDKQRELWKLIADMDNEQEINVRAHRDGGIVEYKYVKTLKNYISELDDETIDDITRQIQALCSIVNGNGKNSKKSSTKELTDEELQDMIVNSGF